MSMRHHTDAVRDMPFVQLFRSERCSLVMSQIAFAPAQHLLITDFRTHGANAIETETLIDLRAFDRFNPH